MRSTSPRLAVITGAGSGIGRATAHAFARAGATVVVTDRDEDTAGATVAEIIRDGGLAEAETLDVTDEGAWTDLAARLLARHGPTDVLVNNAGYTTAGRFVDHTAADWDRMLAVNVTGVVYGSRIFASQMIDHGTQGSIINVASGAAYAPLPFSSPYCATKAAVKMFSECLRLELADAGVGVTVICPGVIKTNFYLAAQRLGVSEEEAAQQRSSLDGAVQRVGHSPDTVARAIVNAVRTNPAIKPVTAEAHLTYLISRLSPGLLRLNGRFAGVDTVGKAAAALGRLTGRRTTEGASL